mmetsp:Transcript_27699/g.58841  ORF Transcript_27699/g.58841 Transcript_27699/m.58841 type:complete len:96 (+) Transcript_27699:499-786(+)
MKNPTDLKLSYDNLSELMKRDALQIELHRNKGRQNGASESFKKLKRQLPSRNKSSNRKRRKLCLVNAIKSLLKWQLLKCLDIATNLFDNNVGVVK